MATVRAGNKSVLVIVDVQFGVMNEVWDAHRIIANVSSAVDEARSGEVPVIWVQHADEVHPAGTSDWEWAKGLSPQKDEAVVAKQFSSSFEQSNLDRLLSGLDAAHIVLAGAATNWCIRATAYAALDRGYDLTLVSEAHTTVPMAADGRTIEAEDIVDEFNAVMAWMSYPGRRNRAVPLNDITFIKPVA